MNKNLEQLEQKIGKRIAHNEPLALHTTLKDNTLAEYYVEVERQEDLVKAVQAAQELGMPIVVIGSGSFLSYPDETIAGLIIKNNCRKFDKMSMRGKISGQEVGVSEVLVQAESGTLMNQLVRFTIEEGLEGLEYQLGMPGTVGGALHTDAGYKKTRVSDVLSAIRVLTDQGEVATYMTDFKKHLTKGILLSAIFRLTPADKKLLWQRGHEAVEYRRDNG